ncbi:hypothetical protein SELMODRAFT_408078 [Selaginella moellendorffii]|uniref:Pentatricopeptide repeat-containing protein n=1 Tax=Selaginella moellendorffii TaxID=88036 RepID=D8R745_SELML|nr:hypothetical protein SELMODRAFT_408078 [Selaginella moellendorffii]
MPSKVTQMELRSPVHDRVEPRRKKMGLGSIRFKSYARMTLPTSYSMIGEFFNGAGKRDVKTWNIRHSEYTQRGVDKVTELFKLVKDLAVDLWVMMIEGYARAGLPKTSTLYETPWTMLLMAYFDQAMTSEVKHIFKLMPNRNSVAWNGAHSYMERSSAVGLQQERTGRGHVKGMIQRYVKPEKNSFLTVPGKW